VGSSSSLEPLHALTVSVTGQGFLTSHPAGIDCPTACTAAYASSTTVTLQATANRGWRVASWSGDCANLPAPVTLAMNRDRSCGVAFEEVPPTLAVSVVGPGSVKTFPAGVACPSTCSATFPPGTTARLRAVPQDGARFVSWTGDCAGQPRVHHLRLDRDRTCTATFEPRPCDDLVRLEEGRFRRGADPYELKGVNFIVDVGARVLNGATAGLPPDQYAWDYFLAPYGNYFPDNDAVCFTPWSVPGQCCRDAASCRELLDDQHLWRLEALNIPTVRLVGLSVASDETDTPPPATPRGLYVRCTRVWDANSARDQQDGLACRHYLDSPQAVDRWVGMVREAIRLLGDRGIRTVLLTGGGGVERPVGHPQYLQLLQRLGAALVNEPDLASYDPFNEPVYFYDRAQDHTDFNGLCGSGDFCKEAAQAVTRSWLQAIQASDTHHLVSVGQTNAIWSLINWDPLALYDHYTTWHLYTDAPWQHAIHGSRTVQANVYLASLGGCGEPCAWLGTWDGSGCHVVDGPLTAQDPQAVSGAFLYNAMAGPTACPVGVVEGNRCRAGSYAQGRDTPVVQQQPFYYVEPQGGVCPALTTFDGAHCHVATGPPGASPFIWPETDPRGFYYRYLEGRQRCVPPAWDDSANCYVGPVPTGHVPFIVTRPVFSVRAVSCNPRKPLHLGETGFTAFPNGLDLDASHYPPSGPGRGRYDECVAPGASVIQGTEAEQVDFLFGGLTPDYPGLFPYSRACGFQGLQWWMFGSVHWGICSEDNFGLYNFPHALWEQPLTGDPEELVERAVVGPFRQMSYLQDRTGSCAEPPHFRDNSRRDLGTTTHRFVGRVVAGGTGNPVANAVIYAWDTNWGGVFTTFTAADGRFVLPMDRCLVQVGATALGHGNASKYPQSQCVTPPAGTVQQVELGDFTISPLAHLPDAVTDLRVPTVNRHVCRQGDRWVLSH
jgi:hypothetical protein